MSQNDSKLFQDPRIQYPTDGDFSYYISKCRSIIENTRIDLNKKNAEIIIDANSPFELKPVLDRGKTKYGALLIHGLYDTPFVMKDIGLHLQKQNLLVRSILLPGHGTVPGALLNVSYKDWLQATHYGVTSLSKEVEKVFLVGFSTGASLALYHTLHHTYENIAGLILLAPAIKIDPMSAITNLPPKINIDWLAKNPEIDYTKYCSFAFNSTYQIYKLTQEIKKITAATTQIHCPVFVGISKDDQTVCSAATLKYFEEYSSPKSKLLIYTDQPNGVSDPRIIKRPSSYPDLCIKNISHVSIPIAPDNSHYGMHGDFVNASHVEENLRDGKNIIYDTYNDVQNQWRNLLYRTGIYKYHHQRLTFNPDFNFLQTELENFIQDVCV